MTKIVPKLHFESFFSSSEMWLMHKPSIKVAYEQTLPFLLLFVRVAVLKCEEIPLVHKRSPSDLYVVTRTQNPVITVNPVKVYITITLF